MKTKTVKAIFPGGIGQIEIPQERANQIKRLQKIIMEQRAKANERKISKSKKY